MAPTAASKPAQVWARLKHRYRQIIGLWRSLTRPCLELMFRLPFVFGVLCGLLLALDGQCRQVLTTLLEADSAPYRLLSVGLLCLALLAWILFAAYLEATSAQQHVLFSAVSRAFHTPLVRTSRLVWAMLSATAPFCGLVLGLIAAGSGHGERLAYMLLATAAAALTIAVLLWIGRYKSQKARKLSTQGLRIAVAITLTAPLFCAPTTLIPAARWLGPVGVIALQLTAAFVTVLYLLQGARFLMPVARVLAVIWLLTFGTEWIVRHTLETKQAAQAGISSQSGPPAHDLSLKAAYESWLEPRIAKFRARNSGQRYPVFIVAAEGGGIYAAAAVATLLAHMRDENPTFGEHLFAISAVSGGAVGTALYSALPPRSVQEGQTNQTSRADAVPAVREMLRQDHLSPVLAVLVPQLAFTILGDALSLYLEPSLRILNRLFPTATSAAGQWIAGATTLAGPLTGIIVRRDQILAESLRCRSTPQGLDCAGEMSSRLAQEYTKGWKDGAHALVLNTTWAETGQTVAFAPFHFTGLNDRNITSFLDHPFGAELSQRRTIDAALDSARFPLVLPPLTVVTGDGRLHFVDGGYSDNSGVAVAGAIFEQLRAVQSETVDLRLLLVTSEVREETERPTGTTSFIDLKIPLETLLNVRARISSREVARIVNAFSRGSPADNDRPVLRLGIGNDFFLGWTISSKALDAIACEVGARLSPCSPTSLTTAENVLTNRVVNALLAPPEKPGAQPTQ